MWAKYAPEPSRPDAHTEQSYGNMWFLWKVRKRLVWSRLLVLLRWYLASWKRRDSGFNFIHLKLDAETPCRKRLACLINSATIAAFKSKLETIDWSVIYNSDSTNDSYDTFSSLLISAYHKSFPLNLYTLNPGVSLNPGFQKVSLYPVTGRILFINNSKLTLLNPTNLDITSIEIITTLLIRVARKNIFMTN